MMRLFPALSAFVTVLAALTFPILPARAQTPAASPSGESVQPVVSRCRSPDLDKERECYFSAIEARLAAGGAAEALRTLDRLAALDEDVRRDGHMYAHRIGISALKSQGEVSRVFASCTPAYQSGCYHGVIQSYFLASERAGGGVTAESVDALCADYRGTRPDLLFQCTHGLGHGLTMLGRHDLPQALTWCDLLSREGEREMCYAGAFMESIVNATHPHQLAKETGKNGKPADRASADHGGHGGHGGHHGHGAMAAAKPPFKALDPKDPHYPCSIMAEKYVVACYVIQTSAMLHHNGQDVGATAKECARAPEKARVTCFMSLGRDVSTIALGDHSKGARLCDLAEAGYRPACHRGVVESIVNMNAEPAEGIPYCKAVADKASKLACYTAVGLQATVLPEGAAVREKACRSAEAGMLEVCLGRPAPSAEAGGGV